MTQNLHKELLFAGIVAVVAFIAYKRNASGVSVPASSGSSGAYPVADPGNGTGVPTPTPVTDPGTTTNTPPPIRPAPVPQPPVWIDPPPGKRK